MTSPVSFLSTSPLRFSFSLVESWIGAQDLSLVACVRSFIHSLIPLPPFNTNGASQLAPVVKNPPANAGDVREAGSIPGSGRSLEEGMATHTSILVWRIPWSDEPGGLLSMGLQRVGHDWSDFTHACMHVLSAGDRMMGKINRISALEALTVFRGWETANRQRNKARKCKWRQFPGGAVVRTLCFHCRGSRFHLWLGD